MAGYGDRLPERDFEIEVNVGDNRVGANARNCGGLWHVNYKHKKDESQTLNIVAADVFGTGGATTVAFQPQGTDFSRRPKITNKYLLPTADAERYFVEFRITVATGVTTVRFATDQTIRSDSTGDDLSDAFETNFEIVVTSGSNTLTITSSDFNVDRTEPYTLTPKTASQSKITTFATAIRSGTKVDSTIKLTAKQVERTSRNLMAPVMDNTGNNAKLFLKVYDAETGAEIASPFTASKVPTNNTRLNNPGGLWHTADYMWVYDWLDRKFYRIDMSDWLAEGNQSSDITTATFFAAPAPQVLTSWAQKGNDGFALFADMPGEVLQFTTAGVSTDYVHFQLKENGNFSPVALDYDDTDKILYVLDSVKNQVFTYDGETGEYDGSYSFFVDPVVLRSNYRNLGVTLSVAEKYIFIADKKQENENYRVKAYNRIPD